MQYEARSAGDRTRLMRNALVAQSYLHAQRSTDTSRDASERVSAIQGEMPQISRNFGPASFITCGNLEIIEQHAGCCCNCAVGEPTLLIGDGYSPSPPYDVSYNVAFNVSWYIPSDGSGYSGCIPENVVSTLLVDYVTPALVVYDENPRFATVYINSQSPTHPTISIMLTVANGCSRASVTETKEVPPP